MDDIPDSKKAVLALFISLAIFFSSSGYAHSPDSPNTDGIIIVQGNAVRASVTPSLPLKFQSLGVLGGGVELYDLLSQYSWDVDLMTRIFMAESRLNPNAVNWKDRHRGCSGSFGIAQIGCIHFGKYGINENNWHIPEVNIAAAYQIFLNDGLNAWGAYINKSYLRYSI